MFHQSSRGVYMWGTPNIDQDCLITGGRNGTGGLTASIPHSSRRTCGG